MKMLLLRCPIEVKSGNYRGHKSLDMFCEKFSSRMGEKYVILLDVWEGAEYVDHDITRK